VTRASLLVDRGKRAHAVTLRTGLAFWPKAAQTLADLRTLSEQGRPEPIVFASEPAQNPPARNFIGQCIGNI
jgi:hypothetical protein